MEAGRGRRQAARDSAKADPSRSPGGWTQRRWNTGSTPVRISLVGGVTNYPKGGYLFWVGLGKA